MTTEQGSQAWSWEDVDPLTKVVIATFASQPQALPGIEPDAYVKAMGEALPEIPEKDVNKAILGVEDTLPRTVVDELCEHEDGPTVQHMALKLGFLAGNTAGTIGLATQAAESLARKNSSDAERAELVPVLELLSELAVSQLADPESQRSTRPLMQRPIH